jgi:hypothetical protein
VPTSPNSSSSYIASGYRLQQYRTSDRSRCNSLAVAVRGIQRPYNCWILAAWPTMVSAVVGAALAGCAAIAPVGEPSHVFHPHVADVSPPFQVVDRRPEASRSSRKIDQSAWSFAWFYGDAQFSHGPVQVVADRFAVAFPRAGPESALVVTELEIGHQVANIGPWGPSCTQLFIDCFFYEAMEDAAKHSFDVVSARLSGTFENVPFRAAYRAHYKDDRPHEQEARVLSALQNVIDEAVKDVRERRNPSKSSAPDQDRATMPELPRPWYLPAPSQLGH